MGIAFFWHRTHFQGGLCFHEKKVDVFFFSRLFFLNRGGVGGNHSFDDVWLEKIPSKEVQSENLTPKWLA